MAYASANLSNIAHANGSGPSAHVQLSSKFNLSLDGTFDGSVVLQRSFNGAAPHTVCID